MKGSAVRIRASAPHDLQGIRAPADASSFWCQRHDAQPGRSLPPRGGSSDGRPGSRDRVLDRDLTALRGIPEDVDIRACGERWVSMTEMLRDLIHWTASVDQKRRARLLEVV